MIFMAHLLFAKWCARIKYSDYLFIFRDIYHWVSNILNVAYCQSLVSTFSQTGSRAITQALIWLLKSNLIIAVVVICVKNQVRMLNVTCQNKTDYNIFTILWTHPDFHFYHYQKLYIGPFCLQKQLTIKYETILHIDF